MNPKDLLYAETHEWVRVSDEGGRKVGTVGITAFALEQLTDLVHMVLPKVGSQVRTGEALYTIFANSETGLGFACDLAAEHSGYELAP